MNNRSKSCLPKGVKAEWPFQSDHRLGRNFYKGLAGGAINILLAAAAYNFKRAMKALWDFIKIISQMSFANGFSLKDLF